MISLSRIDQQLLELVFVEMIIVPSIRQGVSSSCMDGAELVSSNPFSLALDAFPSSGDAVLDPLLW